VRKRSWEGYAKHAKMLKETVFEGYYSSCYETDYLSKEPEYQLKRLGDRLMRRWFQNYLKDLSKDQVRRRAERNEEEPDALYFSDLIPKLVFRLLSEEPNTKLRFKIVVKAEQI
jgi:hypothetical protein